MLVLVVAALISVPDAHAQQQTQETQPPAGTTLPQDFFEGIRNIFRSIFGQGEDERPAPQQPPPEPPPVAPQSAPQSSQQAPVPSPNPQEQPAKPAAAAAPGAAPQAVAVSPSAAAAPLSLHSAIAKGDYANALKMIEQGADVEAKDPGVGASALHYAAMKGKGALPMVGVLLQRGADVNSRTRSGTTPLHTAVLYNHYETAELLIEKGADVNAKSASGVTPIELARAAKYRHFVELLRGRGAN
jgi:hypothetical protein